jgi:hypothetical protein
VGVLMDLIPVVGLALGLGVALAVVGVRLLAKQARRATGLFLTLVGLAGVAAGIGLWINRPQDLLEVRPATIVPGIFGGCAGKTLVVKNIDSRGVEIQGIVINGEFRPSKRFKGSSKEESQFQRPLTTTEPVQFPVIVGPGEEAVFLVCGRQGTTKEGYEKDVGAVEIRTKHSIQHWLVGPLVP